MVILQAQNDSGKRSGYLIFVGDQSTISVESIRQVTTVARHRFPRAVLFQFFDDIHGGRIFRSGSDAMKHDVGTSVRFGNAATFLACDTERHAPVRCFRIGDEVVSEGQR